MTNRTMTLAAITLGMWAVGVLLPVAGILVLLVGGPSLLAVLLMVGGSVALLIRNVLAHHLRGVDEGGDPHPS